jgi:hypothetical protein
MWTLGYIALVALVNVGFAHVPLLPLPSGDMWPPMSLAVGLVFVARDFAQREAGHGVILLAMLAGGALSYAMADPFIAFASVAAFLVSEAADWLLYTVSRRPFHERILWSSALSTPLDSAVFLALIGHLSIWGVAVMTLSKMLGAGAVWSLLRRGR